MYGCVMVEWKIVFLGIYGDIIIVGMCIFNWLNVKSCLGCGGLGGIMVGGGMWLK